MTAPAELAHPRHNRPDLDDDTAMQAPASFTKKKAEILSPGQAIRIDENTSPMESRQSVQNQYGRDLGDLVAIIQLPYRHSWFAYLLGPKPEEKDSWKPVGYDETSFVDEIHSQDEKRRDNARIFCFSTPASGGTTQSFTLVGQQQLAYLREREHGRISEAEQPQDSILTMKTGQSIDIGHNGWLPGQGTDKSRRRDPIVASAFDCLTYNVGVTASTEGALMIHISRDAMIDDPTYVLTRQDQQQQVPSLN